MPSASFVGALLSDGSEGTAFIIQGLDVRGQLKMPSVRRQEVMSSFGTVYCKSKWRHMRLKLEEQKSWDVFVSMLMLLWITRLLN